MTGREGIPAATPPIIWHSSVRKFGVVGRDVLRVPHLCASERVIERFEDETGDRLSVSPLLQGAFSGAEGLDFGFRPPAEAHENYGRFVLLVVSDEEEFRENNPEVPDLDEGDIGWHRGGEQGWIAFSRYGDVVLEWFAGDERETDERWERLDAILDGL